MCFIKRLYTVGMGVISEIMDGLLQREPITRLVFVLFFSLAERTAIYAAVLPDMEDSQPSQCWRGKLFPRKTTCRAHHTQSQEVEK